MGDENSQNKMTNIWNLFSKTPSQATSAQTHASQPSTLRGASSRRHSIGSRPSEIVSHALHEVVSEHIIAGPRGTLLTLRPSRMSVDSIGSHHTLERMLLRRRTMEGIDLPVDLDDAITLTGHGKFQYILMALCGFIYSCCSLSTTTLSFVLPAAQYDFDLTSSDKGILNTAPLWGMVGGAYIWGNFADSRGRKFVLLYSLLIDSIAATLSSLCQSYRLFFFCRFFNGFGIIGATSIVFAYLGEFMDPTRRDNYLSRLELFWTFGIIALPVIGTVILTRSWAVGFEGVFVFNSWRLFVLTCGIPSLIGVILIAGMPESPRFLLLQGKDEKTKKVLVRMFTTNTDEKPSRYPVSVLKPSPEAEAYYFPDLKGVSCYGRLKHIFIGLIKQHEDLFHGRSFINIIITCFIDFGVMSVYYSVILWVPELLHRQELFLHSHPFEPASLCHVSERKILSESSEESDEGKGTVDILTFLHTFVICLACLPSNIMLLYLISHINKKILLVGIMLLTAVPTLGVYFMDSVFQVTAMLCLFEATATLVETVLFCAIVEIFPLNTRGTALSLTVTVGRLGAVLGNIVFGLLIDNHCPHIFIGMTTMVVLSAFAALFLPKMKSGH
ncbi:hypothetical protein J6590_087126 [Homalodisca vitripennis]|nr:hypothetical protein J6590_087126 [Homalodisca vitripennis]